MARRNKRFASLRKQMSTDAQKRAAKKKNKLAENIYAGQKEYEMSVNMILGTKPELLDKIHYEMLDAIVQVVEKYDSYIGGGFGFREIKEDEQQL